MLQVLHEAAGEDARGARGGEVREAQEPGETAPRSAAECAASSSQALQKQVFCRFAAAQLSSYGLCFLGVWYGFSNQVLSNAWFYSKTFPFGAVFYMLASYF